MTEIAGRSGLDVERELTRVADRLRALGPRLERRPEAVDAVRAVLQEFADLCAGVERRSTREVPELPPHALADQLLVVGHDLLAARGAGEAVLGAAGTALIRLRRTL